MNKNYISKAISFSLALSLVCSMFPAQVLYAAQTGAGQQDGITQGNAGQTVQEESEEIETEYIEINTVEDFLEFAENCYIDSWSANKRVTLNADLNFSGTYLPMIPVFAGVFDGKGHVISGFHYAESGYIVGLFRYIQKGGVVENLELQGDMIGIDEKECIGSLCGVNYGTIKNCSFQGNVSGRDTVGGLAGINESTGTISDCTVSGRVTGYYDTGGVAGKNHGVINFCTNHAGINDNSAWVEEDDDMGVGIFLSINVSESETELYSGVDAGGIAGYSDGIISRCSNYGIVGYEHTGYNVGGIAGRQAGVISLCTNAGSVYGRKDVGGIVGQMEPYIEVDEAESLRNAVNKLHDLIDDTIDDMQAGKNALKTDFDSLSTYGDGALQSGDALAGQMTDFVDGNIAGAQAVVGRMEHITKQLPDILHQMSNAGDGFSQLNDVMKKLIEDLDILGKVDDGTYDETVYNRVTLLSTVGGKLRCDKSDPKENETVTITVVPNDGYGLKDTIKIADANGKAVSFADSGDNKYTFVMPKRNVKVSAEFVYTGAPQTIGAGEGNAQTAETGTGREPVRYAAPENSVSIGMVQREDPSLTEIPPEKETPPADGNPSETEAPPEKEEPSGDTVPSDKTEPQESEGASESGEGTIPSEETNPSVNEALPEETDSGDGITDGDTMPDTSGEEAVKYAVTSVSVTGGNVVVPDSAAAGETVYVIPNASSGYMLRSLSVKTAGGVQVGCTKDNGGRSYSFIMPAEDVTVTPVFEKLQVILSSNLSGDASFSAAPTGIVTLSVTPDSSYTLKGNPEVTDADGNKILLSKKQSGAYVYEFDINGAAAPCRVNITFQKQNKTDSLDTARKDMEEAVKNLQAASDNANGAVTKIKDIMTNSDGSVKEWGQLTKEEQNQVIGEIINLAEYLGDMSQAASTILSSLSVIANILAPYASDAAKAAKEDINQATGYVQNILDSLKSASNGVKGIVNYLNAQPDIRFSQLGDGFDATREDLHKQLQGISDSLKSLSSHASDYSDKINADLRAVNDQLNIVFNLLADHMVDYSDLSIEELYEEISDEEIDTITTGRTDTSTNKGIVKGDINVGGIAGSMSVDEEDPEDSAAGSVEYQIGRRFITKCVIKDSVNEGYITAKKNGAGGIVGYMKHGMVLDCEGYGSVESTEGDYVGGICGESLTAIERCYALCMVSGGKNVGGIAGYADTLKDCYTIVDGGASVGRIGAIAGQVTSYENTFEDEETEPKVCRNYYVGETLHGIDDISYVDVAEPIAYEELLTVEKLPVAFWHLKVIYRIEDEELGTEEVKFGESLAGLQYPEIPEKEGYYGVWPDYSGEAMAGNLVINAEYKENVTVVESNEKLIESEEGYHEKPYALVEQIFTEDTVLNVGVSDRMPPDKAGGKEYVIYDISLENSGIGPEDRFAVRIYNPYEDADVWGYFDGDWTLLESKKRGQYLQVSMEGDKEAFCVIKRTSYRGMIIGIGAGAAAVLLLAFTAVRKIRSGRRSKNDGR